MKTSTAITMSVCTLLLVGLAASLITINQNNQTITQQQTEIAQLKSRIDPLDTLVFHVSEKGEDYPYARLPNASDVYNQLLILNNNTYEILLMPEYMGHQNWNDELAWISENFGGPQGIPLMLCAAGGGENPQALTPKLTTQQIQAAQQVANIKWIRIAEICSWHLEQKQDFPTDYVREILEFAKQNDLKVFWTEWKNDYPDKNHETFSAIKNAIQDYEDIVWVSFSTNSGDLEPTEGFLKIRDEFTHIGASVQAFYWDTRGYNLIDMPPSLLLEHTLAAKGIGAEIIQFEPYWYFFNEEGKISNPTKLLFSILT
jgi:hypothetical protein